MKYSLPVKYYLDPINRHNFREFYTSFWKSIAGREFANEKAIIREAVESFNRDTEFNTHGIQLEFKFKEKAYQIKKRKEKKLPKRHPIRERTRSEKLEAGLGKMKESLARQIEDIAGAVYCRIHTPIKGDNYNNN